ncbi:hypothetical protein BKA70DRAFT_1215889 [Coprinopsis sp. MPI-PUGE-AT-0042]|nr:hypothetical protein BKA70DRAFT_1215889 [Coprinopsis sp. MPI-PUGE-AT-0042]
MKFTIVAAASLALLSTGVAAQGVDRQDTMRNLARSLIEEYEDLLESRSDGCVARNPSRYQGMECDPVGLYLAECYWLSHTDFLVACIPWETLLHQNIIIAPRSKSVHSSTV